MEARDAAMKFLIEGGEYDEAAFLAESILGFVARRESATGEKLVDVTLFSARALFERLNAELESAAANSAASLALRLQKAINHTLPHGLKLGRLFAAPLEQLGDYIPPSELPSSLLGYRPDHEIIDTVDLTNLTRPGALKRMGRNLTSLIVGSDASALEHLGFRVPSPSLPDLVYFAAMSRILQRNDRLPSAARDRLELILTSAQEANRQGMSEVRKEMDELGVAVEYTILDSAQSMLSCLRDCRWAFRNDPSEKAPTAARIGEMLGNLIEATLILEPALTCAELADCEGALNFLINLLSTQHEYVLWTRFEFESREEDQSANLPGAILLVTSIQANALLEDEDGNHCILAPIPKAVVLERPARITDRDRVDGTSASEAEQLFLEQWRSNLRSIHEEIRELIKELSLPSPDRNAIDGFSEASEAFQQFSKCTASDVVDAMKPTFDKLHDAIRDVTAEHREVKVARDRLAEMQADGMWKFLAKVDPESLRQFATILGFPSLLQAAKALKMPESSLRAKVTAWRHGLDPLPKLADILRWRRTLKKGVNVPLNESITTGAAKAVDYPDLIGEILETLIEVNDSDPDTRIGELIELIRSRGTS